MISQFSQLYAQRPLAAKVRQPSHVVSRLMRAVVLLTAQIDRISFFSKIYALIVRELRPGPHAPLTIREPTPVSKTSDTCKSSRPRIASLVSK